jgi:hypothetical protein
MKKLLAGCLIVVFVGAVGLAVAGYLFYRAASPLVQQARDYVSGMGALADLDAKIANQTAFAPPGNGELTAAQVERFARVQDAVRKGLGTRVDEIEKKHKSLAGGKEQPSPTEVFSALSDVIGLFADARGFQVDALNAERFSQSEYTWVRTRVYAAAGMQVTSAFDFRKLEELAKAAQDQTGLKVPEVEMPKIAEVPERNRELVKPYLSRMDQWLPLAFFGL